MYVRAGRAAFARPCVGVHMSTALMSSSLLLQLCPACLVRLTWIVFVIGGRWPYSWCLVGCCRQIRWVELPWPENPASTACDKQNHWTTLTTLLGLISSVYRDLPNRRSNQRPQNAESKHYHWPTGSYGTQAMPNKKKWV